MCIHSKSIYTNPRRIFKQGTQLFNTNAPCRECWQCQASQANEYLFRAYHEALNCFNQGGFLIWDSLTYSEETVPWIQNEIKKFHYAKINNNFNFRVFRYSDVQKFIKNIRQNWKLEHNENLNIKYLIVGEYGEEDYYIKRGKVIQGTHRPHYHILMNVYNNCDPMDFVKFYNKYWTYGITDTSNPEHTENYIWKNNIIKSKGNSLNTAIYITKYIHKSSTYVERLKKILYEITISTFNNKSIETKRQLFKNLKKDYLHCHKCSKGFGLCYINENTKKEILDNGYVTLPRFELYKTKIRVPQIYINHIIYKKIPKPLHEDRIIFAKDCLGYMVPNKYFHIWQFKKRQLEVENIIKNFNQAKYNDIEFLSYLKDISEDEYIKYIIYYKGRYRGYDNGHNKTVYKVSEFNERLKCRRFFLNKVQKQEINDLTYKSDNLFYFIKHNTISDKDFNTNFDYIYEKQKEALYRIGIDKEKAKESKDRIKKRFKLLI